MHSPPSAVLGVFTTAELILHAITLTALIYKATSSVQAIFGIFIRLYNPPQAHARVNIDLYRLPLRRTVRLHRHDEPPRQQDKPHEAALRVRVLGRREAVLVRVQEEDVEQLVRAGERAQEDAAVADGHAQRLVEQRFEAVDGVAGLVEDFERRIYLLWER